jgi:predicted ABC-type ATPase
MAGVKNPSVVVIGGPNGAGKTTISKAVLAGTLGITEFVNADIIAQGLSGFEPERAAMQAGRIMLRRVDELAEANANFAFETTLASRTFAPWLRGIITRGYRFYLTFVWVSSADISIRRVRDRVSKGGHFVPDEVVRRRHARGTSNFLNLYLPIAHRWVAYNNSGAGSLQPLASGGLDLATKVADHFVWKALHETAQ